MTFEIETVIVPLGENIKAAVEKEHTQGLVSIGTPSVYGRVYSNGEVNHVVKIGSGGDMGYRSYVQTAAQFRNECKYLPNITRAILYRHPDEFYESRGRKPGEDPIDIFVVYMEKLRHPRNTGNCSERGSPVNRFTAVLRELLRQHVYGNNLDWSRLRPVHQDLLTILLLAKEMRQGNNFDIHYQNAMVRGRQFVVTDPLTGH
jgi:hypothetical protein